MYIVVRVVLNNRNPIKTVAWVLVLLCIPLFGLLLYFFFGADTRKRKYISRRSLTQIQRRCYTEDIITNSENIGAQYECMVAYLNNVAESPVICADGIEIISSGDDFIISLLREIHTAKEHIHVQFYIFEDDAVGRMLRDALMEKAREGVEVRVIYDSVGCWSVKPAFFDAMRCAGVYVSPFLRVRFPLLTNKVNYRNHRKVVIIDGRVGFVGGFNIADRYVRGLYRGDSWRDTMLLLRGQAVHGLQRVFLMDWYFADRSLVTGRRYFPLSETTASICTQVVASNPVGLWRTIMNAFVYALGSAKNYVYIQSPYFMPGDEVLSAMQRAALSGVDVRVMIPERSDNRLIDYASYSYVGELLNAGVKVYLYKNGFLHAKTLASDDVLSSVGSANMDFRSFDYNFEVTAFVYNENIARQLKQQFMEDVKCSSLLTLREYQRQSVGRRVLASAMRLFSPLL